MDRCGELSIFLSVVEQGSFSAAARALTLSPSAVSKSISRQESRLGVRLFNRNSRSVGTTPEEATLYASGVAERKAMVAADLATGRLVRLLPEFEVNDDSPIYVAYQHRRYLNPRIRAFVDFLSERFR